MNYEIFENDNIWRAKKGGDYITILKKSDDIDEYNGVNTFAVIVTGEGKFAQESRFEDWFIEYVMTDDECRDNVLQMARALYESGKCRKQSKQ